VSASNTGRSMFRLLVAIAALWSMPLAADDVRWGAEYFPNVTLTTHEGRSVRFYDDLLKGKVVAIDLIYTTCQYACPLETARMAQIQRLLGDRVGREIFFYSITIDPAHDTPDVLKAYAERYHAGPGWLFLTGRPADIELISKKLGLYSEPDPSDPDGHTPTLLVGNESTGQWVQNSALDNPQFLARTIGDWLSSWAAGAKTALASFADARPITMNEGEYSFRNHCAACHTIGGGDGIGPDLKGVTARRDRRWLTRFIVTPEQMLAENDPIATALLAQYKQVRMPNLSLSDSDAGALIDYLKAHEGPAPVVAAPSSARVPRNATQGDLASVIEPYLRIHAALAASTLDGIIPAAAAVATAAAKIGTRAAPIKVAVNPFAQVTDLAGARETLATLTEAIVTYARVFEVPLGEGITLAYCPMARRYWLQSGDRLENPYYGRQMATCGRIVAELPTFDK